MQTDSSAGDGVMLKVFISWSGDQSHALARILRDWLPDVLPFIDPWLSSEDIVKGRRWDSEIAKSLEDTSYCIVCVTPGVQRQPWVNFEAGAVAKIVDDAYVSPLLLGVSPEDLSGTPLSMFQCTVFGKLDFLRLLRSMNKAADVPVNSSELEQNFALHWIRLSNEVARISLHDDDSVGSPSGTTPSSQEPVTALDRIRDCLSDVSQWSLSPRDDGCNGDFYHQMHPEIAIKCSDAPEHIARNEEWTRGEIRKDNNLAGYHDLYHHQQRLARIRYVSFDDHKKSMVAPKWEPCGRGRFYYYAAESIEYAVHKFYCQIQGRDDSRALLIGGQDGDASRQLRNLMKRQTGSGYYCIPVLRAGEFAAFRESEYYPPTDISHPSGNPEEQYELFLQNQFAFEQWRVTEGNS